MVRVRVGVRVMVRVRVGVRVRKHPPMGIGEPWLLGLDQISLNLKPIHSGSGSVLGSSKP